ncbi:UNKNOWN [Stylonychia lemnae]|uniref:Dopa-dioxygenase n=1 Tax=Stylonychia lemnae TaxID=5949 RepID=A0A077ZNH5_STYLE|nr:UNKNOWN [Stylonychia lemnae]|eukprot:CDW71527.1 UNKNOWN [Stylonychia lemnae]
MNNYVLTLAVLLGSAITHPTYYKVDRNITCVQPSPAQVYSYHIHLLFFQDNKEDTESALQIRSDFMAAFNDTLGPDCTDLFHNPYACMGSTDQAPDGPFPTAQWSVFVLPDHIGAMAAWVMQHRKSHSMLIHPNSGCEIEDHSNWTLWGGQPWSLDLTTLHYDKPFPWDNAKDLIQ